MEQRRKQVQSSTKGFCMFIMMSHCRLFDFWLFVPEPGDNEWRSNQALLKVWTPLAMKLAWQFDWLLSD
jgi:hypothetical protein